MHPATALSYIAMPQPIPQIIVKVRTTEPIEVEDFAAIYTALGSQYRKFIQTHHPELAEEATIYVKQVKKGSIVAELVPWAVATWVVLPDELKRIDVVVEFVKKYGELLGAYFVASRKRPDDATRSDLNDWSKQVAAIANDPVGSAVIQAAVFEDGKKKIKAAFQFTTPDARIAAAGLEAHRLQLEKQSAAEHSRVLMVFHQANVRSAPVGKRTGERVRIEEISPRVVPLVYASALAENRIKAEIITAEDNLFRKGFVVDVNVALLGGRLVAYRVTHVHQVIDLPYGENEQDMVSG